MEAGNLRHRVALQAPLETRTSSGQIRITYVTYAQVWAGFQPQSMSHTEQSSLGGKRAGQTRVLILMRQRSDVQPNHRILWDDGRVFDVIGVLNTFEMVDEMVFSCVQVIT